MEEQDQITIQRYLDGELSPTEREVFEEKLALSPDLQQDILLHKKLIEGIKMEARSIAWQQINNLEQKARHQNKVRKPNSTVAWRMAAAFALILVAGFAIYLTIGQDAGPERLYAENFSPYPPIAYAPVRGKEPSSNLERAFAAYTAGQYQKSMDLLADENHEGNRGGLILFYEGNALMALGKPMEAEAKLKAAMEYPGPLALQMRWYLSMSYLAQGKTEQAKELLSLISSGQNSYSEKASKIISNL